MSLSGWDFLKLITALRDVGICISLEDLESTWRMLNRYPELESKTVVQSLLIHREEERILLDKVWFLLFGLEKRNPEWEFPEPNLPCSDHEKKADHPGQGHGQGLGNGNGGITLSLFGEFQKSHKQLQMKNMKDRLQEMLRKEIVDFEEQQKYLLGQSGYFAWINSVELAFSRGELSEDDVWRLKELGTLWAQLVQQELYRYRVEQENSWQSLREEYWRYKPLNRFTKQEENAVHQALRQMSKKLAVRPGRRKIKAHHGTICLPAAIREMVRGKGIIQRLEYEKPSLQRPELVVLCDISNSVAPFSDFLLYLIQKIKGRFRRVRIFLFIDTLWDISYEAWEETENHEEQIRSWGRKHSSGYTDYGEVFKEFVTEWLPEISSRTTLLILGDGLNNFRPAQSEYLEMIHEKVKRVFWLNPLEEKEWSDHDNVLREYAPYCSQIFRCRTIEDLWGIARKVL